jgi:hypothetical protein
LLSPPRIPKSTELRKAPSSPPSAVELGPTIEAAPREQAAPAPESTEMVSVTAPLAKRIDIDESKQPSVVIQEISSAEIVVLPPPAPAQPGPKDRARAPGFQDLSMEFFTRGEQLQAQDSGSGPLPTRHESLPAPEIDVAPVGIWREISMRARHEKKYWPLLAGLCVIVLIGLVGFVALLVRGGPSQSASDVSSQADGAAALSGSTAAAPSSKTAGPASREEPSSLHACTAAQPSERLATMAWNEARLETWAAGDGLRLAVGFASAEKKAEGLVLELPGLKQKWSYSTGSLRTIRHVVPYASGGNVRFSVDDDDPALHLKNEVSVATDRVVRVGWGKDGLSVVAQGGAEPTALWPWLGRERRDSMRALALPSKGVAVTFRVGDTIWLGWVDEGLKPKGPLHRVQSTGAKVGAPSIGWNGREVAIAYSHMPELNSISQISIARARFGESPSPPEPFNVPNAGPGGPATAPLVIGVDWDRWLLVWTEGPSNASVIRGQTYDAQWQPIGAPLELARKGADSLQAAGVVVSSKGAVAYLIGTGDTRQLWAAALNCP